MHRKGLVVVARTALVMLGVAAVALIGIGVVMLFRGDPPELSGVVRDVFGKVFVVFAFGAATILGVPAALGLWAMAGAHAEDAHPALSEPARRVLVIVAVGTVIATAVILLTRDQAEGRLATLVDLALVALVAMGALGLAAATSFSPHRGRAVAAAVALVLVALGPAWLLQAIGSSGS